MNPFFVYLIKSTISLALFYIVFKLTVSRDKMHSVNRFVLLGILVTSAIIPFADIPVFQENNVIPQVEMFSQIMEAPVLKNSLPVLSEEIERVHPTKTASVNPVLLIYLFAIILLFARLIISIVRVFQIIQKAEKQPFQNYILAVVKDFIHPFSFLRNIVISEKDYTENKEMVITHEYAHIKHFHAIDMIICELFTTIHWFNPFMWLLRLDLRLIHEYQADQAVLNKGIDATKYQLLVIEKAVGERRFAMANHFTQKPILKRIKMMKKKNKNRWNWMKLLVFIPVVAILLMAFSKEKLNLPIENNVLEKVEPQFVIPVHNEQTSLVINVKNDGYYIDNKLFTLDEVVNQSKTWQKTGREDILLQIETQLPLARIIEVREAMENANVYHVNQSTIGSDEIIYPAGDVSYLARFNGGSWNNWLKDQLIQSSNGKWEDWHFKIKYSFIIDKNGKVRDVHIIKGCENAEINQALEQILKKIPDWEPAKKGNETISVYYREIWSKK